MIAPTARGEEELRHKAVNLIENILKERRVSKEVRLEENVVHGRTDARIGLLVFEFKEYQTLERSRIRKEALAKMRNVYFEGYIKKGLPKSRLVGVITDGWTCTALTYDTDTNSWMRVDPYGAVIGDEVPFQPISEYSIWFEGAFTGVDYTELSPQNLLENFRPSSGLGRQTVKALWECFADPAHSDRKTKFFDQWKILFSIATEDVVPPRKIAAEVASYGLDRAEVSTEEEVRRFLFIVHTYYALLLKLLAVRIVDELGLGGPTTVLERIKDDAEKGIEFAEGVIPRLAVNVVEEDVFSWPEGAWTTHLKQNVQEMASRLAKFDVGGVQRDVLKRVYQQIIPEELRKALGEFYTKDWAANLVLDEASFRGKGRLLDPSCGSGTFLALAIQRAKRARSNTPAPVILSEILSSIVGFDVNPVAVATARINYLLSIIDLLRAARPAEGVSLPVYLCDSVVVPSADPLSPDSGVFWVKIAAWKDPIGVPVPTAKTVPKKMQDPSRVLLRLLREGAALPVERFLQSVRKDMGDLVADHFSHELRELHKVLNQLEKDEVDGIWASFILNFFAPVFERPFDFVVGNPPWVAPRNTPEAYRLVVSEMIKGSGYQEEFKPRFKVAVDPFGGLGSQYVACLPFEHLALSRYLAPEGTVAFLLTSSLMKSLNAGGWREKVSARGLQSVVDLTMVTDIHEGAASWAFVPVLKEGAPEPPKGVEFKFATRPALPLRRRNRSKDPERPPVLSWDSWQISATNMRLVENDEKSPWLVGNAQFVQAIRKMQLQTRLGDIYPGYQGIHTSGANGTFFLQRIEKASSTRYRFLNEDGETGLAESEVIFPLVKGVGVRAWRFETSYMLLPHSTTDFHAIPEDRLKSAFPDAWSFLHARRIKLRARPRITENVPFYNILYLSRNKMSPWKVAFPEVSPMIEASVIPPKVTDTTLGERFVIPDHKVYYVTVSSEDEAHFVAGILNSSIATAFVYQLTTPKAGIPWRDYHQWNIAMLPLPALSQVDSTCRQLISLARELAASPDEWTEAKRLDLDEMVSELYGLSRDNRKALSENLSMLSRGLLPATISSMRQRKLDQRKLAKVPKAMN